MLGIRQFLKKEDGMCPICTVPYVRKKRDLKASYFDVSCIISAWTLHCPECGYEVILPGIARIRAAGNSQPATGERPGNVMQPTVTITGADMPEQAMEDAEAKDKGPPMGHTEDGMNHAATGTGNFADSTDTSGIREGEGAASIEDANPDAGTDTGIQGEGTDGCQDPAADASEAGDAAPAMGSTDPSGSKETASPAEFKTGGSMVKEAILEEKHIGGSQDPEPARGHGKAKRPEKTGKPADPAKERQDSAKAGEEKPDSMPDGRKLEGIGKELPKETRKAGKDAPEPMDRDKRTGREAGSDRKTILKGQPQKEGGENHKKQQTPKAAHGGQKNGTPDMPVPGYGRPGAFQGRGPSRFPNSSIFPSSAISNLDMLRASVQAGIDKKVGNERKEDTHTETSKYRNKETPSRDPVKGRETGNPEAGTDRKPDGAVGKPKKVHEKQEISADNKNKDDQKDGQKQLSTENKHSRPDSEPPAGGSGKSKEKYVSAKNGSTDGMDCTDETRAGHSSESKEGIQADPASVANKQGGEAKPVQEVAKGTDKSAADDGDSGITENPETDGAHDAGGATSEAGNGKSGEPKEGQDGTEIQKDPMEAAKAAAKKFQEKIPPGLAEKIPVLSQISKQQKRSLFVSEEKRYLEEHVPHKQAIINDLIYNTDNSEMFLRAEGQYGLDNPCVHYNYRTQNGNFFRCTVKYKHEDSIRALDIIEAKRMLEEYPDMYKRFFPDSVTDA